MHEVWSADSQENSHNCSQRMSDCKAKMHQIRFRLGLCPRPCYGSLHPSPDPLTGFKGPTSKGREEREGKREGRREKDREREVTGGQERGEEWMSASPILNSWVHHCKTTTIMSISHFTMTKPKMTGNDDLR